MRHTILALTLILGACAKGAKDPICVIDPIPLMHEYPDGKNLKSERVTCDNGCTTYRALDQSGQADASCQ